MSSIVAHVNSAQDQSLTSIESSKGEPDETDGRFSGIIGRSETMQKIFRLIERVAESRSTILICGESGSGKELVARAIHRNSLRRNKPFIPLNCGAIPENLLESELFGHVKGAFTGATASKPGKFELADGGTIFLDEIGDMSPELQVKILRVLEEREFERVGGSKSIKVDVRIIAATHRDLESAVRNGTFREDLFYRLYVIPIHLPPLRNRRSDIPILISHFIEKFRTGNGKGVQTISDEAMNMLMKYNWPGNVRELKNTIERMVVLKGGGILTTEDVPEKLRAASPEVRAPSVEMADEGICLMTAVTEFEKSLILQSLERTNWVKNKAAKLLRLNRTTLVEKIKRHEIQPCSTTNCL